MGMASIVLCEIQSPCLIITYWLLELGLGWYALGWALLLLEFTPWAVKECLTRVLLWCEKHTPVSHGKEITAIWEVLGKDNGNVQSRKKCRRSSLAQFFICYHRAWHGSASPLIMVIIPTEISHGRCGSFWSPKKKLDRCTWCPFLHRPCRLCHPPDVLSQSEAQAHGNALGRNQALVLPHGNSCWPSLWWSPPGGQS